MPNSNAQAALIAAATTFSTVGAWSSAENGQAIIRRAERFKEWLDEKDGEGSGEKHQPDSDYPTAAELLDGKWPRRNA